MERTEMKAVLITDMPVACEQCWIFVMKPKGVYCRIRQRYNNEHRRPEWCPLKPLPKALERDGKSQFAEGFTCGFNTYQEILKTYGEMTE